MQYGKTRHGTQWHILLDDRPICAPGLRVSFRAEKSETNEDRICRVCDNKLRLKGSKARSKKKKTEDKTVYTPRNVLE